MGGKRSFFFLRLRRLFRADRYIFVCLIRKYGLKQVTKQKKVLNASCETCRFNGELIKRVNRIHDGFVTKSDAKVTKLLQCLH